MGHPCGAPSRALLRLFPPGVVNHKCVLRLMREDNLASLRRRSGVICLLGRRVKFELRLNLRFRHD
jgi:hypothetical protein